MKRKIWADILGILMVLTGLMGVLTGAYMIHPGLMIGLLGWLLFNNGQRILAENDPLLKLRRGLGL